jgi:hypothetical protein
MGEIFSMVGCSIINHKLFKRNKTMNTQDMAHEIAKMWTDRASEKDLRSVYYDDSLRIILDMTEEEMLENYNDLLED